MNVASLKYSERKLPRQWWFTTVQTRSFDYREYTFAQDSNHPDPVPEYWERGERFKRHTSLLHVLSEYLFAIRIDRTFGVNAGSVTNAVDFDFVVPGRDKIGRADAIAIFDIPHRDG
jgi:hypothetical protein